MGEFWETSFQEKKAMWGNSPADSAIRASELFKKRGYKEILIPGIGYGRNAKPFLDAGMNVTGIEISETAIVMAKESIGPSVKIFRGSVSGMPFEEKQYDGIFSFALIHLLNEEERRKLISTSYSLLKANGCMIFISIAETSPMFGTGKKLSDRLYETRPGVRLFFYDEAAIDREFGHTA
ncbi:class I SAM-dependent methyltransferase [Leptospira sp. 201903071]|uniref:class I SAM-dependent methyltransferase n=1 Tax=Leptospira ainazelensis TaxID=2810034 RepID=UPI001963D33D|nr:class I SAM-dependent methyltransferase [Leptospira ainazelensis]MBM9500194.1 class I SAM-dependent methyltransferase [Leptospira ainazelensis]